MSAKSRTSSGVSPVTRLARMGRRLMPGLRCCLLPRGISKGRRVRPPTTHPSAFIAATAAVMGDVTLGEESSVWYGAVLRGDMAPIVIGSQTNIQDGCIVHVDT